MITIINSTIESVCVGVFVMSYQSIRLIMCDD
jgi:hypothetical protein